jgi:hypothetical protein
VMHGCVCGGRRAALESGAGATDDPVPPLTKSAADESAIERICVRRRPGSGSESCLSCRDTVQNEWRIAQ